MSNIEWTEKTWNPIAGCKKVSPGCKNCYAETMAKRLAGIAGGIQESGRVAAPSVARYMDVLNDKGRWNGNVVFSPELLTVPMKAKKPSAWFVNSMSDLFHDDLTDDQICQVVDAMIQAKHHIFQVLTKRPHRMMRFLDSWYKDKSQLSHIWWGTSVENDQTVHRAWELMRTPGITRFLSIEPLLEAIPDFTLNYNITVGAYDNSGLIHGPLHWVIVGGESGPGARPINADWVRDIRDLCQTEGIPFFFKQWGGVKKKQAGRLLDGRTWDEMPALPPRFNGARL